jgi:beta-glucosidase
MVGQMQPSEKFTLMRGNGYGHWHYVGSTEPVSRLGIPSLTMQDAAGGFRTTEEGVVGTVTCWPSLLSMAATWDTAMMFDFAEALGFEFYSKGANMILGPSINVHRMGWNGRNFEYLSGEDPFLGAMLTKEYVRGVQGQRVMTTMKHFPFNHEESNRNDYNVIIDDKTAWELYYPPYQAAVDAGVTATMCSYNREDGPNSCSNGARLNTDLKGAMGYKGFIQSDWGATHGTTVDQGLDQDMPGDDHWYDDNKLNGVDGDLIDDSATRILASLYKLDLVDNVKCDASAGECDALFFSEVRNGHSELALAAATESIVLLKNNDALPLADSVKTIAVVGAAADAPPYDPNGGSWSVGDFYSGGGSGHVVAGHLTTPLQGIQLRALQAGIEVFASASDDVNSAVDVAKKADVTIIVAGTSCGESYDRDHLDLDGNMDNFVPSVAAASQKTVVLTEIPGQTLMSWRDSADAIATNFLAGEETGTAWAKVLFGDHSPTGKLPIMIPASESDTIKPSKTKGDIQYTEGMRTSYRNTDLNAAFPFGHGLSYTTFDYGAASAGACDDELCVKLQITNSGSAAGKTVVQLYLEFPEEAQHPAALLKGFAKTGVLQPGDSEEVSILLSDRYSLTYWENGQWIKPSSATAHIGASSVDIRQTLVLNLDKQDLEIVV